MVLTPKQAFFTYATSYIYKRPISYTLSVNFEFSKNRKYICLYTATHSLTCGLRNKQDPEKVKSRN